MSRGNQVLAALLVVQLALTAVVFWPRGGGKSVGGPLFPDLKPDQVVGVTVHDGDRAQIHMVRRGDGWVIPEADDYPCKSKPITDLIAKIAGLTTDRLVARTHTSQRRLRVSEDGFAHMIEIELAGGRTHRLYLGNSPAYNTMYARADDQDEVYMVSGLSLTDVGARAANWLDTTYFSVPQDKITYLALENANGRFEFTRRDDDTWAMAGLGSDETLNKNNLTSLLGRISTVRLTRPLGKEERKEYGMDEPNAVVTIRTRDGKEEASYTLRVGAKDEEKRAYVTKVSSSPYYVEVADYSVREFVERKRDDFISPPPTPAATITPTLTVTVTR